MKMKKIVAVLIVSLISSVAMADIFTSNEQTIEEVHSDLSSQFDTDGSKQSVLSYLEKQGYSVNVSSENSDNETDYHATKKIKSNVVCMAKAIVTLSFTEDKLAHHEIIDQKSCL